MTEKLKYKVGDKVLIEAEVEEVDDISILYQVESEDGGFSMWLPEKYLKVLDTPPPKPKIPQAVMDWYLSTKNANWDVEDYLTNGCENSKIYGWLCPGNHQLSLERQHALATLIAYGPQAVEVEKEKRYKVTLKSNGQILIKVRLARGEVSYDFMYSDVPEPYYTKQELIDAGFEGVFDNQMFEVEEVE